MVNQELADKMDDKSMIQKTGDVKIKESLYDTSDKFMYQKKTWHMRAKDGDTLPAFDGTKR